MKKVTRCILLFLSALLIISAFIQIKSDFPDLKMPLISRYIGNVKESSIGSRYKTYFFQLAPVEKQAYNLILDEIYDMPERILVPDLSEKQLDRVFKSLLNDNPDLIFLGRKCRLNSELWNTFISFDYIMSKEEYAKAKNEMSLKRDLIIASLSDLSDEYKTELEIHDYIIEHCDYKLEDEVYSYSSAYGALVDGKAACEGYSKAAKYVFDKVGIESILISGKASGDGRGDGDHMWNIVKINGDYYHLDLTWDDPVSTNSSSSMSVHTYFNLTDDAIGINHRDFSYSPGCTATEENYSIKNGLRFENYSSKDNDKLRTIMLNEYNSGERNIQISFVNKESYDNAFKTLITDKKIYNVLGNVKSNRGNSFSNAISGYYADESFYTLTFIFR